jgi:hypothetical protein
MDSCCSFSWSEYSVSNANDALWTIALRLGGAGADRQRAAFQLQRPRAVAGGAASARSRDTIYAIDDLLSELTDAETGQRRLSADAKDFLSWNPIARPLRRSTPRSLR